MANFQLLMLGEWLLEKPDEGFRAFMLEVMEGRFKEASTIFSAAYCWNRAPRSRRLPTWATGIG